MKRIYFASSRQNTYVTVITARFARALGHSITFEWWGPDGEINNNWDRDAKTRERARILSNQERSAVREADLVILLAPEPGQGLGCFIEVGMALALETPVWVVEGMDGRRVRESVFWYLEQVDVMSLDTMIRRLELNAQTGIDMEVVV